MPTHPTAYPPGTTTRTKRSPVQLAALVVGVVFLVVGILGFVPGITSDYDSLGAAGHESHAMLLGIFQVSVLHNIVHLLFGVVGVLLARRPDTARSYLIIGGVVYLVLWLYGLFIGEDSGANFVPVNDADNWLHLVLGLGMIALGLLTTRRATADHSR
jgi:arginine exporter protein ArgO